jgi:hypothetical protein
MVFDGVVGSVKQVSGNEGAAEGQGDTPPFQRASDDGPLVAMDFVCLQER